MHDWLLFEDRFDWDSNLSNKFDITRESEGYWYLVWEKEVIITIDVVDEDAKIERAEEEEYIFKKVSSILNLHYVSSYHDHGVY